MSGERTLLSSQEYAMRLLQLLQDYGQETIKVDTVIVVVKMLTRHPVENAIIFATGDAYQFGAYEFANYTEAAGFLARMSEDVAFASFLNGEFKVYKYPYRSRVMQDWVFVGTND